MLRDTGNASGRQQLVVLGLSMEPMSWHQAAVIDGGMDALEQASNRGLDIGAHEKRHMNISAPLLKIPISSS
jgi:hypothetical protein